MKVSIGNYTTWVGPYQIAEKLWFWEKDEDKVHKFGEWLATNKKGGDSTLMKICNWIESKKKRKIKVRIDRWDTWSMESTLAIIILPMLKQLKETKHGSPGDMLAFSQASDASPQKCFNFYSEDDQIAWDTGHLQWVDILDKMIWAFEQLQPDCDWEEQYWITHPVMDSDNSPDENGNYLVKWKVEGECDWVGRKQHEDRIQEGLELFGKYYRNLWD